MLDKLLCEMKKNNNIITTARALEIGVSKSLLSKYAKSGLIERVRQGVYTLPDSIHDDMYTLMLRSEYIIFSHESALFLLGLSDRTPFEHSVTIPSDKSLPRTFKDECKCYYVSPDLYKIGITEMKTTFGNMVRCYNAERCICDLLRSRNRLDEEIVLSSIKNYIGLKNKDLNRLSQYARLFHVEKKIKTYLEVLL